MPFSLSNDPSQSEISEAINYLLANFGPNLSADPDTGQITGPSGIVIAYLYRYLSIKYADSFDGSLNFSNTPTNRGYYGVNNSNSTTESINPADYIWFKVAGGFGTTKFLFYQCSGGRQINFVVATAAPNSSYIQDSGTAIDLDIITSGATANSATTAYLVQSQSSPAPTGFPLYTSGNTLPPGWSATIGTVAVGQVVWYSFGQYNGSSVTVNGIPANSTYWSTPVAASVFQDIRSDNWNGSTPPTYGVPSTYGTVGYYISRSTGNVWFNNGIFRGDITGASGTFTGTVQSGSSGNRVILNESPSSYLKVYDSSGNVIYSLLGVAGLYTNSTLVGASSISAFNVTNASGYNGTAITATALGNGHGIQGVTNDTSGFRNGVNGVSFTAGSSAAAVYGSGDFGVYSNGKFGTNNSTLVTNLNANYLQGYTASNFMLVGSTAADSNALGGYSPSSWARIFATNSGTANAAGSGVNLVGSTSTGIAGAYVGTSGTSNVVTFTVQTTSPSDFRLKEDIADTDLGLAFVKQLRPVSYKLKADPRQQKGYGFIAQEVEALIGDESSLVYEEPNWQVGDEIGFKTIHYPSYIAVLTKAIQELTAKVEALEAKVK